jgi:aminoglycoside phosphotransferase (APT) family kinase protein
MDESHFLDDETLAHAIRAAKAAARRGDADDEVKVLHRSRRVVLLLPAIATVARIGPADDISLASDTRELCVTRHLVEKGAPVAAPSPLMGPMPFVEDGLAVTLWPNIEHETCDYDDSSAVARAADALRRVHEGLADYPDPLPSYWDRIAQCATLLRGHDSPSILSEEDRTFLLRTYDRLTANLSRFEISSSPIHGDAHIGNVFFTRDGPLWTDFETACHGPYEWDAAALLCPSIPGLDRELYETMAELRSFCVAVWCSALAHDPEKRAAAREQLASLRGRADASASKH